jgi:hypothetical protein
VQGRAECIELWNRHVEQGRDPRRHRLGLRAKPAPAVGQGDIQRPLVRAACPGDEAGRLEPLEQR